MRLTVQFTSSLQAMAGAYVCLQNRCFTCSGDAPGAGRCPAEIGDASCTWSRASAWICRQHRSLGLFRIFRT